MRKCPKIWILKRWTERHYELLGIVYGPTLPSPIRSSLTKVNRPQECNPEVDSGFIQWYRHIPSIIEWNNWKNLTWTPLFVVESLQSAVTVTTSAGEQSVNTHIGSHSIQPNQGKYTQRKTFGGHFSCFCSITYDIHHEKSIKLTWTPFQAVTVTTTKRKQARPHTANARATWILPCTE